MRLLSLTGPTARGVAGLVLVALSAACGDGTSAAPGGPPPPIVGEIGPSGAAPQPAAKDPAAPRAERPIAEKKAPRALPRAAPEGPAGDAPAGKPQAQAAAGTTLVPGANGMAYPKDFDARAVCLMPKLGTCSAYGKNYARLAAVETFCGKLGGEKSGDCPANLVVASCKTTADVVTFYYASGEKPYTKATAEAKCVEKGWEVLALEPVK